MAREKIPVSERTVQRIEQARAQALASASPPASTAAAANARAAAVVAKPAAAAAPPRADDSDDEEEEVVASGSVAVRGVRPAMRGKPRPARRTRVKLDSNMHYHDLFEARLAKRKREEKQGVMAAAEAPAHARDGEATTRNVEMSPCTAASNITLVRGSGTQSPHSRALLSDREPQSKRASPPGSYVKAEARAVAILPILTSAIETIDVDALDEDPNDGLAARAVPDSRPDAAERERNGVPPPYALRLDPAHEPQELDTRKKQFNLSQPTPDPLSAAQLRPQASPIIGRGPVSTGTGAPSLTATDEVPQVQRSSSPTTTGLASAVRGRSLADELIDARRGSSRKLHSAQNTFPGHMSLALNDVSGLMRAADVRGRTNDKYSPAAESRMALPCPELRAGSRQVTPPRDPGSNAKREQILLKDTNREDDVNIEGESTYKQSTPVNSMNTRSGKTLTESNDRFHMPLKRPRPAETDELLDAHKSTSSQIEGIVGEENEMNCVSPDRSPSSGNRDIRHVPYQGICSHCVKFAKLFSEHEGACSAFCGQSIRNSRKVGSSGSETVALVNFCSAWEKSPAIRFWRIANIVYRPRPFNFVGTTNFMKFSPFTAVAESMPGVCSDDVCATCGAGNSGGALVSCQRCPCAFHMGCIGELNSAVSTTTWLCNACRNATNTTDEDMGFDRERTLSGVLRRLAHDARCGNSLDMALHPSMHLSYVEENGCDWLRCVWCKRPRIVKPGVSSEACRPHFRCGLAFWLQPGERHCGGESPLEKGIISRLESWIAGRSRRRSVLFSYYLDEQDRGIFGWPPLDSNALLRAEEAIVQSSRSRECAREGQSVAQSRGHEGTSSLSNAGSLTQITSTGLAEQTAPVLSITSNEPNDIISKYGRQDQGLQVRGSEPLGKIVPPPGNGGQEAGVATAGNLKNNTAKGGNSDVIDVDTLPTHADCLASNGDSVPVHSAVCSAAVPEVSSLLGSRNPAMQELETSAAKKQIATVQMLKRIAEFEFEPDVQDTLVDLAMIPDHRLYSIFAAFRQRPNDLTRQLTRYAKRYRALSTGSGTQAAGPVSTFQQNMPPSSHARPLTWFQQQNQRLVQQQLQLRQQYLNQQQVRYREQLGHQVQETLRQHGVTGVNHAQLQPQLQPQQLLGQYQMQLKQQGQERAQRPNFAVTGANQAQLQPHLLLQQQLRQYQEQRKQQGQDRLQSQTHVLTGANEAQLQPQQQLTQYQEQLERQGL